MPSLTTSLPALFVSMLLLFPLNGHGKRFPFDIPPPDSSAHHSNASVLQENKCQPVTADTLGDLYDCPRPESASPHPPPLRSGFMSGFSGSGINSWLLICGATTGVAAALAGGGGGSSSSTAPDIRSSDPGYTGGITGQGDITSPSFYQTSEYLQRADLDVIKAKEAYANIAALNSANGAVQGGGEITIAILDTGVDPTHQDLAGNILIPCETGLPCREHYALSDPSGHGTHVAGIAAAEKNTSGIHGVAFNARILPGCAYVKGGCYSESVGNSELMHWSATNGASVANMSYAFTLGNRTKVASDIAGLNPDYHHHDLKDYLFGAVSNHPASDYQQAKASLQQGLVTVVSAGNFNNYLIGAIPETGQPSVMALAPFIYRDSSIESDLDYQWLTVINTNNQGVRAASSHACGDAAEFCLAAPGSGITSTTPGENYRSLSGTSMSAPQVSGAFALVAGAFPSLELPSDNRQIAVCLQDNPKYNRSQCHSKAVVNRLLASATDLGEQGTDPVYGRGLLNLEAATSLIGEAQLQASSGATYTLDKNQLNHSFILGNGVERQLYSIQFIAVDNYDNAGFVYPASALLGAGDHDQPAIDPLPYLHRSLDAHRFFTTRINDSLSFGFKPSESIGSSAEPYYELSYTLSPDSALTIGYGSANGQNSTANLFNLPDLGHLVTSQAFGNPLSYFHTQGYSVRYQYQLPDQSLLIAEAYHDQVSDNMNNSSNSLVTTSVMFSLTRPLTNDLTGNVKLGGMREDDSLLGTHGSGIWHTGNGSSSIIVGASINYQLSPALDILMSYDQLVSDPDQLLELMELPKAFIANTFSGGLLLRGDYNWQYGLFVTQPIRLQDGKAGLDLPVSYNEHSLNYQRFNIDLEPDGRHLEYELSAFWTSEIYPLSFKIHILKITDYANIPDNNSTIALLNLSFKF